MKSRSRTAGSGIHASHATRLMLSSGDLMSKFSRWNPLDTTSNG
jgi:hypothetical protein